MEAQLVSVGGVPALGYSGWRRVGCVVVLASNTEVDIILSVVGLREVQDVKDAGRGKVSLSSVVFLSVLRNIQK